MTSDHLRQCRAAPANIFVTTGGQPDSSMGRVHCVSSCTTLAKETRVVTRRRTFAPVAAAALAAAALAPLASADTLPNLVAMATTDNEVAVTFAAYPTDETLSDAGSFSTQMIEQFGLVGIPNFQPEPLSSSVLVCWADLNADEAVAVYGIQGQGETEAGLVCDGMISSGLPVHWN
jgi:hypothetical protein